MAFIPAVGTVPVGEEAVPSTTTVVTQISGKASTASGAKATQFTTDPLLDGRASNASGARGNLSLDAVLEGKASTASGARAELLEGTLLDGKAVSASGARGVLSHEIAISGGANAASGATSPFFNLELGLSGSTDTASGFFGAAGVPIAISGKAGSSSGIRGGVTDPLFRQWRFIDPETSEVYRFETNPSVVPEPKRAKRIVYEGKTEQGQTLVFKNNGEALRVTITGKILSEDQLNEITAWSKKRYPVKLRDDLDREITLYVESFEANRGHKVSHDHFHDYRLTYVVL